ncbi:MAG: insulinase family protein [Proteobacteria bacterium]|nr:insulinase family protein [Pseudomonadota bacterium]
MRVFLCAFCLVMTLSSHAFAKVLDIQEFVTEKGIKVWLVPDQSIPVIALSFAFETGTERNPPAKQGLARLLSNTLDEGAGDINAKNFQARLRDHAIDFSFEAGRDVFSGNLRTLSRHKEEAFKLLKLAVTAPRFEAEAIERMRAANLSSIKSNIGDADWIASRLLFDRIYKGHPYALNSGGTLASMKALTAGDLKGEWKRIATRDRLYVGITGEVTIEEAKKIVDDTFGTLPEKSTEKPLEKATMPQVGKPVFYAKDMPQTVLWMAWDGISVSDPDYYAGVVADYIFGGGGFSSRLMAEIREKRGLTYGIQSDLVNNDYADRYVVMASLQPANVAPTIEAVNKIADEMKSKDVSPDELTAAKEYLTGSLPLGLSSSARIASTLVSLQLNRRPVTALDDYRAKIEAVTPADIRRVTARLLNGQPQVVLVGAKPDGLELETLTSIPNAETVTKQ